MAGKKKSGKKKNIEQYDHKDKQRLNNPPVGLVDAETDKETGKKEYAYDPHLDPQLIWAGKAERTTFEVPTVSLHVHERIEPRTIIEVVRKKYGPQQGSFFGMWEENPPLREAIEFYKHPHGWSNRLIAGDSLQVMNSLLEKEGMAGKVQMIYIDPPYGIRYGSNFQPFVNKRDVKDGKDEDLTAEPEMIKAFRDTWELGIHSYLTYLKDRFLLAKDLLSDTGSLFLQIGEENVHIVRTILDEVFGKNNCCGLICFVTTGGVKQKLLANRCNFLIWYAKDIEKVKYRQLYSKKSFEEGTATTYTWLELSNGQRRGLNIKEKKFPSLLPKEAKPYRASNITTQGNPVFSFEYQGKKYDQAWKTTKEGLKRLSYANRFHIAKNSLSYVNYLSDFTILEVNKLWTDTFLGSFGEEKIFVVQTGSKTIERALLMTTDPGDLVLDPTCGSGTTAYCAEKLGRRWITCDTSRVAIALAKQRVMTALYDYYEFAHPDEGISSGFKYENVPHITLKSIAHNEEIDEIYEKHHPEIEKTLNELHKAANKRMKEWEVPHELDSKWPKEAKRPFESFWSFKRKMQDDMDKSIQKNADLEVLYDQPFIDKSKARVTGPFTVEAVPSPVVKPLSEVEKGQEADESIARSGETLRQSEWRDELLKTGIRAKGGKMIDFSRVEPLPGTTWLHANAETKGAEPERLVISFGPENAPLEQRQVERAIEEARTLVPKPKIIAFASFHFDPEAAKDIDETDWPGVTLLKVQMNTDLLTEDLKKKRSSNESFWLIGQPDVKLTKLAKDKDKGKYQVEVLGFDYYNPVSGMIESGGKDKIAMWMLDTDYDGRSLFPRQFFFPMAGPNEGWGRLARNLKAEIDQEMIEAYRGTVSLPFEPGDNKRIAVKIVDDRGIESLKIIGIE